MSIPVWTWPPDWGPGVRERISWLTAIEASRDGTERRQRMRSVPRTTIEFDAVVIEEDFQRVSMMLQANQAGEWLMPIWWDGSRLDVSTAPAILFDENDRAFPRVGAWSWAVLVDESSGEYEPIEIAFDDMGGFWLLKDPIDPVKWPVGSRIYPARRVLLSASQALAHITAGVSTLPVEARVQDDFNWPPAPSPEHLEYLEPNRARPVSASFELLAGTADFSVGGVSVTDFAGKSFRGTTYDYFCGSRAELADIRAALSHLSGRLNTLRMPTFQADRLVTSDCTPGWIYLWSKPDGYKNLFDQGVDLYIKPLNGQPAMIARPYDVWPGDPLGDEIEFDPGLPISFNKDEVKISLVYKSRLASDTVEILHHTAGISEVSISYRSVK